MNDITPNKIKVLVCDDDPTHLLLMNETLDEKEFDVFNAANGEMAIDQFKLIQPDIVLLDVNMPKLNGFEVCDWLRNYSLGKDVPILMITGANDHTSIEKAFKHGATDFLPKPINWPMITHRLKYMIKSSQALIDLKRAQNRLEHIAFYDVLTDLPNRQLFVEIGKKALSSARRNEVKTALLFINIDRFKRINDSLGHKYGDQLLQHIARILEENIRDSDIISIQKNASDNMSLARLRSDEFTVLLSNTTDELEVHTVCSRLIDSISLPVQLGAYEVVVTPSIGVSIFPDDGNDIEELIKFADIASNRAKQMGKGNFSFYTQVYSDQLKDRLKLEEAMRTSLVNKSFNLAYQPQVSLIDNSVSSVEVLLRWFDEELGHVSPLDFIPLAEETGMILELGEWVLKTACLQAKVWQTKWPHRPIMVAVNISGLQLSNTNFCDMVSNTLSNTGLPAELLQLEFTESIVMADAKENIAILQDLKKLGVSLSIDDFGTGYSSLSYLKKFPINELKVDRSFIIDIASHESDRAIVRAILALAEQLELGVVIEGTETEEQIACINAITNYKCISIQGYFYHKPAGDKEITAFIEKRNS